MKRLMPLCLAAGLHVGPAMAGPACPAGFDKFVRGWEIDSAGTNELVHFQLWNRGTETIILKHWNAVSGATVPVIAGPTGTGDPNEVPVVTRTGTTTAGSAVVTGLATTSDLMPEMLVLHPDLVDDTNILSINSGTSITLTKNAIKGGSKSLLFTPRQRLTTDIVAYTASFPEGVKGSPYLGTIFGPAWSNRSKHGELRAQVSRYRWFIAQAYQLFATPTSTAVDALDGWPIPPGQGWTVRSEVPNIKLRASFVWCEPVEQQVQPLLAPMPKEPAKRKAPAKKATAAPSVWSVFK